LFDRRQLNLKTATQDFIGHRIKQNY